MWESGGDSRTATFSDKTCHEHTCRRSNKVPNSGLGPKWDQSPKFIEAGSFIKVCLKYISMAHHSVVIVSPGAED